MYIKSCAACEVFGDQAGHNSQPLDSDRMGASGICLFPRRVHIIFQGAHLRGTRLECLTDVDILGE